MLNVKRVLVLAPHTDDAELGCGGTIIKLIENNIDVFISVFSTAEDSLPRDAEPYALKNEFLASAGAMGIPHDQIYIYNFPVRKLEYHRQDVLETLVSLGKEINPDMVLLPASTDIHQDHQVVHIEGLRAFKHITVWGYELPWNHLTFNANAFVVLTEKHLEAKWSSLKLYESQLKMGRPYFSKEFVYGLAKLRGVQIKTRYAEAFEVLRVRVL